MRFFIRHTPRWLAAGAACALVVPLAGCGGEEGGESTSAAATTAGAPASAIVQEAAANVERLQKSPGSYTAPEASGVTPSPGKDVWFISVGNEADAAAEGSEAFVEGAEALGWSPHVVDGKFNPSNWLAGVRQAVQSNADGIVVFSFDCAPAKQGFVEADAAGIPIVVIEGFDCNELGQGGPKLFTHRVGYAEGSFERWQQLWGRTQADYTIAKTNGEARILFLRETDIQATKIIADEYEKRISECPGCEIVEKIDFVATDLGPALQTKVQQALLKHPDTTVVYANYDGPVLSAVAPAVRASGKQPLVIGAEGALPNLDLIREGQQSVALGYVNGWESYAALDALASIFGGEKPVANSGMGTLLIDREHNLPAESGQRVKLPIDWKAAYEQAWAGGS